ncbi:putative transposase [Oscillibacter valericigenes Sjm18-20]|nr:putative transposase [Oscillibacter valericigenes Sjm18-20]
MFTFKSGETGPCRVANTPTSTWTASNWGGEFKNVSILVAIAVNEDGYREVLGAAEGMKEDKASWVEFFKWLKSRGLEGVRLIVGDKCLGMLEAVGEAFPEAKYRRCVVHIYRNSLEMEYRQKSYPTNT